MKPIAISHSTLTTALGAGNLAHLQALESGTSGLAPCHFADVRLPGFVGEVAGLDEIALPARLAAYDCRNNRLAWLGLQQDGLVEAAQEARERFGSHRVAVILGSSTSGILQTELAYQQRDAQGALPASFDLARTHDVYSVAAFATEALGLAGPSWVVSTACSSGAKVFAAASRLIEAGWADAALVGGVDSLCLTTLYGFNSLELLADDVCRPWDAHRKGLSLGEGAAFVLLQRDVIAPAGWLLGAGESSDGHHMSAPHPEGAGAAGAMRMALADAGLEPGQIDYINLHGTGTPSNDAAEDKAVQAVFGTATPCSSTKGATGHTLGAAGAVEASLCLLALRHGLMPGGLNRRTPDAALHVRYLTENRRATLRAVLSNSFGFGGTNASLIFGGAA